MRRFLIPVVLTICSLVEVQAESIDDVAERFAVADDREAVVASLVPGTDQHFYYRCLLWQHQGKLAEVDALLPRWEELSAGSPNLARIRLRQAVLWVDRDVAVGIPRLAQEAGVDLEAVEVPQVGADLARSAPRLPSILPPATLTWEAVVAHAEDGGRLDGWSDAGCARRLGELKRADLRRAALKRIRNPLVAGLVDAVVADLAELGGDFGSLPVHDELTIAQLDAVRAARPAVMEDLDYLVAVIRARNGRYTNDALVRDVVQRRAWIAELQQLTGTWPASAQPLQAFVALHHLAERLTSRQVTAQDVLAVVSRPLHEGHLSDLQPSTEGKGSSVPGPTAATRLLRATGLPPVPQGTALVDEALIAVLAKADDVSVFAGLMDERRLRERFIEAKLVHGIGDAATWLTRSSDAAIAQAVTKRVDLIIDRSCAKRLAGDAVVTLPVVLKNVPALHVRVYALDPANLFRAGSEAGLGLDLAGVVPTSERILRFAQPAIRRHREELAMPECAGPGWWMIDMIGSDHVARVMVYKGTLALRTQVRPEGEFLQVFDETDRAVADATVRIGDQVFVAGKDGSVRLPFVSEARSDRALIQGAGRALIITLQRQSETWSLEPGALLEREQLIAGGQATVVVRPRLRLCGVAMPISNAREVQVEITSTTHTGARRQTIHSPVSDPLTGEWALKFPCDEGLKEVSLTLRATVRNYARGEDVLLTAQHQQAVVADSERTGLIDTYLEQGPDGWSVACLGRAGEPAVGEPLLVSLTHRLLARPLFFRLGTDASGRIHLGRLPDITAIRLDPESLRTLGGSPLLGRSWSLRSEQQATVDLTIHAGQELRLPAPWRSGRQGAADWTLRRGWSALGDDATALLEEQDERGVAVLVGKALPPGRYRLETPIGSTLITVVAGTRHGDVVLHADGIHTIDAPAVLGAAVIPQGEGVRIQVVGRTPTTRVQVLGLRFHPTHAQRLSEHLTDQVVWPRPWSETLRQDGRRLDPELGYILARTQAPRLPGVMLERPGLLLNPWFDDTFLAIGAGMGSAGMFGARHGGGKSRALSKGGGSKGSSRESEPLADFDFLSGPGLVLANLVPDGTDAVILTAAQLGDARELLVQVCDATQSACVIAPTARTTLAIRERRLMTGLPPEQHLVVQRRGQVLPAGGSASVNQGTLGRSRLCATVDDLLTLYQTLDGENGLREFAGLGRWSGMDVAERRRWYSQHACHEVHLFLWYKDRAFFDAVVRPYLANKLQPGFIDQWLLEQDLTPWLSPERHRRLNLCERILLARRLGGERGAQELASVREQFHDLEDEQAEVGARIAHLLVDPNEVGLGVDQRRAPDSELPPMKVMPVQAEEKLDINNGVEINVAEQDYRDHRHSQALIEQQWYRVPWYRDDAAGLFPPSAFWRDVAAWNGQGAFLTSTCLLAGSLNECLVALALCDLPLTAKEPTWTTVADQRQVQVTSPALLLSEELMPQPLMAGDVVVHQRYYDLHAWRSNAQAATPHIGPFKPGVPYVAVSVVFNPTPRSMTVALLAQIPTGALPLGLVDRTLRTEAILAPYEHAPLEHAFYFPIAGSFTQFPTHVRVGAVVVAANVPTRCEVGGANRIAGGDWPADPAAIIARLERAARWEVDLDALSWRLGDAALWRACVAVLERRRWYDDQVWSYSLMHRDTARMAVWLRSQSALAERLGRSVRSAWLTIDPLVTGGVVHADISPLTNPRAHRLVGEPAIASDQLRELWEKLLDRLALEPEISPRSRLELSYALTLQDRLGAAATQFARIDRAAIAMRLQYDYLGAWLALGRGDLAAAARFAASGKDHPVQHWRLRFAEVQAQLDEIAGKPATREADVREAHRQDLQAAGTPSFQARLRDATTVQITSARLKTCVVRWHRLDLEPLFSRAPFTSASAARATLVQPAVTQEVVLAADGSAVVAFPAELHHQAIAVEVSAAGQSQVLTSFADALDVRLSPGTGQLQVLHAITGKPLPATYVKVYVERGDDRAVFHKDGYTDLRGRFDYASLGDGSVIGAKRIALFISNDEAGATVREVSPP